MAVPTGEDEGKTMPEVAQRRGQKPTYLILDEEHSISSALYELWAIAEQVVHENIEDEIKQGWKPDPNGWGPSCIEYQTRSVGMSYWGAGQWMWYIILGFVSAGILPHLAISGTLLPNY